MGSPLQSPLLPRPRKRVGLEGEGGTAGPGQDADAAHKAGHEADCYGPATAASFLSKRRGLARRPRRNP